MSVETIVSIVAAAASALASGAIMFFQAFGNRIAARAAGARRPGVSMMVASRLNFGTAAYGRRGMSGLWILVFLVLAGANVWLARRDAEWAAGLCSVFIFPIATFLVVVIRPIGWGYAAGIVTLLHGIVFATVTIFGRGAWESSPQVFYLAFFANACLVGGMAFLLTRATPMALGRFLVVVGVLTVVWLFLPVVVPTLSPENVRRGLAADVVADRSKRVAGRFGDFSRRLKLVPDPAGVGD